MTAATATADQRSERIGVLAAALAAVSFGAAFPATAVVLRAYSPLAAAATYSTAALLMMLGLAAACIIPRPAPGWTSPGALGRLAAVALVGGPPCRDVGRQRRIADRRQRLVEMRPVEGERETDATVLALLGDLGLQRSEQADAPLMAEADAVADGKSPAGLRQRPPARAVDALDEGHRDVRVRAVA